MLQTYARNRFAWPMAVGFTAITWLLNATTGVGGKVESPLVLSPFWDIVLGIVVGIVAIYIVAEVNSRHSLLPNTDRTVSMTFMLLLAMVMYIHPLRLEQIVLVGYPIACLVMFDAYQSRIQPIWAFSTNLVLGVATLACPQLVWLLIINILSFVILRALTLKSLVASVLGVLIPYWFWGILAYVTDNSEAFNQHIADMNQFGDAGLGDLPTKYIWAYWVVLLMFVVGGIDFFMNIHRNRSRTRIIYYVICLQGLAAFLFCWAEPEMYSYLFPLCITNASILWGQLTSLSKGRVYDVTWTIVTLLIVITTIFIS